MSLGEFGAETSDPLLESLDSVHSDLHDVDEKFRGKGPEIALQIAKAKKALTRAKDLRSDDLGEK